ncbi:MAG: Gfo/Idh/MocA family oxidoreductase [Pseudomonadota bacterium]
MTSFGFGVVGTGMIAREVADAIQQAGNARLVAVSSRSLSRAEAFVAGRAGTQAVEGLEPLLARDDVAAVYVGIPTALKEAVALASTAAGKHVLVDKPFMDAASVERMADAAAAAGLVFMDATHFVHHPRRDAVRAAADEQIGKRFGLQCVFYSPLDDRSDIRFDPTLEPTGALGDLGWYCMRAIVEYLRPEGAVSEAEVVLRRDTSTGAVTEAIGAFGFESGETMTFGSGFQCGTRLEDFRLLGEKGALAMDDFVMNWTNSIGSQAADVPTGYTIRTRSMTPQDFVFTETPSKASQHVLMIEDFVNLAGSDDTEARSAYANASIQTQSLLDVVWAAAI